MILIITIINNSLELTMRFLFIFIFAILFSLLFVTPLLATEPALDNKEIDHEAVVKYMRRLDRLLKEEYRLKFKDDIANGDTIFLNSDDIQFGAFIRRFENALYIVLVYPNEVLPKGIGGIAPVRITFSRSGEIVSVELLESTKAEKLDNWILRTLRAIGKICPLPRGYDKDQLHLIVFIPYGGNGIRLPGGILR
jgi:TonB family protein